MKKAKTYRFINRVETSSESLYTVFLHELFGYGGIASEKLEGSYTVDQRLMRLGYIYRTQRLHK